MAEEIKAAKPEASTERAGVQEASISPEPKKLLNGGVDPSIGKATQFKPGQSGNPAGLPKGTVHLSTHIQRLLNDEEFTAWIPDAREGFKQFKGAPVEAIIRTLMIRAIQGDVKSFDTLAKYGYGTKVELVGKDDGPVQAVVRIVRSGDGPKATS